MTETSHHDELCRLAGEYCNGTLDQAGCGRLDELVCNDSDARRFYSNYMFLHAELYSQFTQLKEREEELVHSLATDATDVRSSPPQDSAGRRKRIWSSSWFIAASLLSVAAVISWAAFKMGESFQVAERNGAGAMMEDGIALGDTVAKITATRNCLWGPESSGIGFGSPLRSGQHIGLDAGLAEITFNDGARVVLEGPASFEVRATDQARLDQGRMAATVPERARGFLVATNGLNVVDLGTEFGMLAEDSGATEIHVFNGLVKAHLLDQNGQEVQTLELNTAEAAVVKPASRMVARIPARNDDFVRSLSVTPGPHDGLYAYDGFNYPEGPLSEQNGGFGWAGPWFNIEAGGDFAENTNGVADGSLEYDGIIPLGNRAVQTAQANRIRRSLSTSVGGVFDEAGLVENQDAVRLVGHDGTTIYLSFLQRVDRTNDVFYGLELHRGDGNPNRVLCIGHGVEETPYGVTSNFNAYVTGNFLPLGEENTKVNFIVIKIVFGEGNRDHVKVYRNPESLFDEEECVVDGELVGNFAFDRISLGNFHGTKTHEVDEIRVGTTFLAVTGRRSRGPDRLTRPVADWELPALRGTDPALIGENWPFQ